MPFPKTILTLFLAIPFWLAGQPCTTLNGLGCACPGGSDTCLLLPDLTISWFGLANTSGGPTEYAPSGNNPGQIRITGSTPNIGYGPLEVRGTDYYICGSDTIYDPTGNLTCPDGSYPTNLLKQRIYKKEGGNMTYEDFWAGGQTYHPSHGHNHVDDWVTFTLRIQDPNEPDTLSWPIVGTGSKLSFCLMDFGTCDGYYGHCRDIQTYNGGTILNSSNIPNYGLGKGYFCSPVEQGISVGYTDIYSESLPGMSIDLPPNTCNGDYWIVAEIDPRNIFQETNDNNNWTAIPVTLTMQSTIDSGKIEINISDPPFICQNSVVTLEAEAGTTYQWSTGDSTQSIDATQPGDYYVEMTNQCGTRQSDTINIIEIPSVITDMEGDTTCGEGSVALTASGNGEIRWYESPTSSILLDTGSTFFTPFIHATTTYYVENISYAGGITSFAGPANHSGSNYDPVINGYVTFDCLSNFTLKSVKVYTDYPANRTIELRTNTGQVLQDTIVYIASGISRIGLNFKVSPGSNYQLGTNGMVNDSVFGFQSPLLKRSDTGVIFPYDINGVLSITSSPFGTNYYFYFYDWEVEHGMASCSSGRFPVDAVVNEKPVVKILGLDSVYVITHPLIILTGQPPRGTFSGPGVSGDSLNFLNAGIGQHTITYVYTDSLGCFDIDSIELNIIDDVPVAVIGPDQTICAGDTATLTAAGGVYFNWNNNELGATINVTPLTTSVYSVSVSNGTGSEDTAYVTVHVNSLPEVNITGLASEYQVTDAPVVLSGIPAGGTFYGEGIIDNIFYPEKAGIGGPYEILYRYSDPNSCENTAKQEVIVREADMIGIAGNQTNNIRVYPNPTNGFIYIDVTESGNYHVNIYSSLGKVIFKHKFNSPTHKQIDLSGAPNGIYFIELINSESTVVLKFIKE